MKTIDTNYFYSHKGSYYIDMIYVWKKMTVIKKIEIISVIDGFIADTHNGKYTRKIRLFSCFFNALYQMTNIKIWNKVMRKHPKVIEGKQQLINMEMIYTEEILEDVVTEDNGADLDEEDKGG